MASPPQLELAWAAPRCPGVSYGRHRSRLQSQPATNHFPEELYFTTSKDQLVNFDFSRVDTLLAGYVAVYDFMRFASNLLHEGQKVLITLAPSESQVDPALRAQLAERFHIDLTLYDWTLP